MGTIEAFNHNFDKKASKVHSGVWKVSEADAGTHFRYITFLKEGRDFFPINTHFIEAEKFVHFDTGSNLRDKNCDGACLWYEVSDSGNETEVLMMVDLKSKFSMSELRDAFMQTLYSYLRLHMVMSLCRGYDCGTQQLRFCVGCQCYDEDSYSKTIERIAKAREANLKGFNTVILHHIMRGDTVTVRLDDLLDYLGLSLKLPGKLLEKNISMSLYLTAEPTDDRLVVDM